MELQRWIGNQAVSRVLQRRSAATGAATVGTIAETQAAGANRILQRKCTCGGEAAGPTGECEECSRKKPGLQTKLRVNEPGDVYEQEADRVADQEVSASANSQVGNAPLRIQRAPRDSSAHTGAAPASVDQALASPGTPLETGLRQEMEQHLGYDFSRVRVHSGGAAEQSVRDVSARAYTVGHDIVFAGGLFAPDTLKGRWLLAHELTHVVQQSFRGTMPLLQRDTVKVPLHPEELATFRGSFRLPDHSGLFPYTVDLYNVPELMLERNNRPRLATEIELSIGAILREMLKSKRLLTGLPPLHLNLDAGYSKATNTGYVEGIVKKAARDEINRLIAQSKKGAAVVVQAIINIMSVYDYVYVGDITLQPDMHPRYYSEEKKTITEQEDVNLLWEWFRISNDVVQGKVARSSITKAMSHTAPLIARLAAEGGDTAKLAPTYQKKTEGFTQRAAKEEVDEMIGAGAAASERSAAGQSADTEDERIRSSTARALGMLGEIIEVSHKLSEKFTSVEKTEKAYEIYDEKLREYLKEVFKERNLTADAPELTYVRRAGGMKLADGIALLKGGLDAVSFIMTVTDPEARRELVEARFGKVAQAAEIGEVLLKFVSGVAAFGGASLYGIAKLAGKVELAEQVLDATVHGIGTVAGGLYLIGVVHGFAVLLDPDATPNEKAEAAVEAASGAVSLAGFASRWVPRLAGFARWSGPIAASLAINFQMVKYAAKLEHEMQVSLHRVDWAPCFRATQKAAIEVQWWMRRLAVTDAILATETDAYRKKELEKSAGAFRWQLIEQQIKPFVETRLSAKGSDDDPASCGRAFSLRLKPVHGLLSTGTSADGAALGTAATFLLILDKAFAEWDQIVMEKEPHH